MKNSQDVRTCILLVVETRIQKLPLTIFMIIYENDRVPTSLV